MKSTLAMALLLCFYGCRRAEEEPPRDTNERGEYFNCEIDGRYWTYKDDTDWLGATDGLFAGGFRDSPTFYSIEAGTTDYPRIEVEFRIKDAYSYPNDTTFFSTFDNGAEALISGIRIPGTSAYHPDGWGITDLQHNGRLILSQNNASRIEGTFHFDAFWPDSSRVFHIRNGHFSIIPE